jgi:hypothetical protein
MTSLRGSAKCVVVELCSSLRFAAFSLGFVKTTCEKCSSPENRRIFAGFVFVCYNVLCLFVKHLARCLHACMILCVTRCTHLTGGAGGDSGDDGAKGEAVAVPAETGTHNSFASNIFCFKMIYFCWLFPARSAPTSGCQWSIKLGRTAGRLVVKSFNNEHSNCSGTASLSAAVIGNILGDEASAKLSSADIKEKVQTKAHVNLDGKSQKLGRGKHVAIAANLEPFSEGVEYLEDYVRVLKLLNPESVVVLETVDDPLCVELPALQRFGRIFVQLKGMSHCAANSKPEGSFDAAFLKAFAMGKYQLLVFGKHRLADYLLRLCFVLTYAV